MASWTDERVDRLKRLWLDGHSASAVARQLGGVTRNAVIGKVHRLGLSGRSQAPAPSRLPRSPQPRAQRVARPALRLVSPPPSTVLAPEPDGPRVPLMQLSACGCRFGVGDPRSENFGFCDAPRVRGSYCGHHADIVYQPASAERARAHRRLLAHFAVQGEGRGLWARPGEVWAAR